MNRDCLNPENQVELQKTMHEFSNTQFENYDTNLVSYGAYPADDITVVAAAGTDRSWYYISQDFTKDDNRYTIYVTISKEAIYS